MKVTKVSKAIALALLVGSGTASAITNVENNATIPFSFSNPGARSLAMGGAFVGAADDATAAFSNPAGLTRLGLDQQLAVEFRHNEYDTPFVGGGGFTSNPFSTAGLDYRSRSSDSNHVAYLAWVLPRDGWSVALFRHELVDFGNRTTTNVVQANGANFLFPFTTQTNLDIESIGASFAYDISEQLSLGLGVIRYDFDIDSMAVRYNAAFTTPTFGAAQTGSDNDIGFNAGLLFKATDGVSIGLTYRSDVDFRYTAGNCVGAAVSAAGCADLAAGSLRTGFKTPSQLAVGLSWRATDQLLLNLDVHHVAYSNLSEGIVSQFDANAGTQEAAFGERINYLEFDDAIEPRFGMEYTLLTDNPVLLRFGMWHEEVHTLRHTADADQFGTFADAALFSAGTDEMHWTGGVGWVLGSFQVDVGVDISKNQDTISASGVWRF